MKKRLLALALCLAMMASLLPITALASGFPTTVDSVHFRGDFKGLGGKGSYPMKEVASNVYEQIISDVHPGDFGRFYINGTQDHFFGGIFSDSGVELDAVYQGDRIAFNEQYDDIRIRLDLSNFNPDTKQGATFTIILNDAKHQFDSNWTSDATYHWHKCLNNGCTKTSGKVAHTDNERDHQCDDCGASVHVWQFTQTDSTLTATCQNQSCNKEVSASLVADSVTLPDSPFNAQVILKGMNAQEIKEEFGYTISDIRYKFKAPGDSDFAPITPADGAREGTYQAAVTLTPLYPQASYALNDDGTNQGLVMEPDGSITFYTEYTAVNPQTTAQTGDNRPIEIMMASVVVFAALAAAAFIVDNKRKYSR